MANSDHVRWLKDGVAAWNARRARQRFRPDLRGANLAKADLAGINLRYALLSRCYLPKANLRDADLTEADLSKCDAPGAILAGATLDEAQLLDSDFSSANFTDMTAQRAVFDDTILTEAKMSGADLKGASFKGVALSGAQFMGTDLMDARSLSQAELEKAHGDPRTRLPQERVRPASWSIPGLSSHDQEARFERTYSVVETRFDGVLTLSGAVLVATNREVERLATSAHRPQDAQILTQLQALFGGVVVNLARASEGDRHDAIETVSNYILDFEPKLDTWITDYGFSLKSCSLSADYMATVFGALGVMGVGAERVRLFFDGLDLSQSRSAA